MEFFSREFTLYFEKIEDPIPLIFSNIHTKSELTNRNFRDERVGNQAKSHNREDY